MNGGLPSEGLDVNGIKKRFGRFAALNGVSFRAEPGEFVALLGPSGSGKTTLLRTIAGLEVPDEGTVRLGGEDFLRLTSRQRRVGLVFQHYALFRHMTLAENIAFGLRSRPAADRPSTKDIQLRVERLLSLVQLGGLGPRFPAQLSGGQQQRVALARALAIEPRVMLLDEPFGALDARVREELRHWLRRVHDATGVTTIFVTHDQEEAMDLADRVALLRGGLIEQIGTPDTLEDTPASAFVFDFLGQSNHLRCRVEGERAWINGFAAPVRVGPGAPATSDDHPAWFRPHETEVSAKGPGIPVIVTDVSARGGSLRIACRSEDGQLLKVERPRGEPVPGLATGSSLRLRPARVFVFADNWAGSANQPDL